MGLLLMVEFNVIIQLKQHWIKHGYKQENTFILSLGTGTYLESFLSKINSNSLNKGWFYWVKHIYKVAAGAQSANTNQSIRNRFNNSYDKYYRWQIWLIKYMILTHMMRRI